MDFLQRMTADFSGLFFAADDSGLNRTAVIGLPYNVRPGTFYTTVESAGALSKDKYSVSDIKALHIRFLPEQEQEMNLSSRLTGIVEAPCLAFSTGQRNRRNT